MNQAFEKHWKSHINLLKRNALNQSVESKAESFSNSPKTTPTTTSQITKFFTAVKDNSLPAVLARMAACDNISYRAICNSNDLRLGLFARGFSDIP